MTSGTSITLSPFPDPRPALTTKRRMINWRIMRKTDLELVVIERELNQQFDF
jgi:hypothetical protein